MTIIAFIIGLIIGIIAGYFIGNRNTVDGTETSTDPDFDYSDPEIENINENLLDEKGEYRFINKMNGENLRYISFMDSLLMDLNDANKDLINNYCRNQETALSLLQAKQIAETNTGFTYAQRQQYLSEFEEGISRKHEEFYKTCPPSKDEDQPRDWWSGEAAFIVMNLVPSLKVSVTLIGPNGNVSREVKSKGPLFDMNPALEEINTPGIYTIHYKIDDLELNTTFNFKQKFWGNQATSN
ncbi:hypothetical protein [Portibacter marinus]|uniref:hypothetical protein n=1 Tax=Portibacter marinus TaxID=2898660 RepID=UPI001F2FD161|nr:hypothetical protein [Portibacter marinus]